MLGILTFYASSIVISLILMIIMFTVSSLTVYELPDYGWVYPLVFSTIMSPIIAVYFAVKSYKKEIIKTKEFKTVMIVLAVVALIALIITVGNYIIV